MAKQDNGQEYTDTQNYRNLVYDNVSISHKKKEVGVQFYYRDGGMTWEKLRDLPYIHMYIQKYTVLICLNCLNFFDILI